MKPARYFAIIQWSFLLALVSYSLFVDRWQALALFVLFMAWKMALLTVLPKKLTQKYSMGRLKSQETRHILQASPFAEKEHKTELLELKAPWPTALVIDHESTKILLNPILIEKLDKDELACLMNWAYHIHQSSLGIAGLRINSVLAPFISAARFVDQYILFQNSNRQGFFERLTDEVTSVIFMPIFSAHQTLHQQMLEDHGEVFTHLRSKLHHLMHSRGSFPPAHMRYLFVDPQLTNTESNQYFFYELKNQPTPIKGE